MQNLHIDSSIQNTEQLIRKLVNVPPSIDKAKYDQTKHNDTLRPGNEEPEDRIEESLEQLDILLNGIKQGDKEKEIAKLGEKYGVNI